jgi:RNA polymerase sigma factor (sigma-70 family)
VRPKGQTPVTGVDHEESWAWDRAFAIHHARLHGFAVFLVGPMRAEDVLSDAMLGCRNADVWPLTGDPIPYLFRVLTNQSRKEWRSHQRRLRRELHYQSQRTLGAGESPNGVVLDPALAKVLLALSPQQRSVVFHAYWLDLDVATIARRLNVSEGTVRKQLARARAKLKEGLTNAR